MNRAISGTWKIETIYIYTNMIAHMEKTTMASGLMQNLRRACFAPFADLGYIYTGERKMI